jgi:hypothetical protein
MSPTLYKFGNARVVMYPKDHNPPHVHVISPKGEAKFDIQTFECFFARGFSKKDLNRVMKKALLLQNPIFRRCSPVEPEKNTQCIAADTSPVFLRLHRRASTEPRIFRDEALFHHPVKRIKEFLSARRRNLLEAWNDYQA